MFEKGKQKRIYQFLQPVDFFEPAMLSGIMALDCDNMLNLFDSKMKEIYIGLGLADAWPEDDDEIDDIYILPEGAQKYRNTGSFQYT